MSQPALAAPIWPNTGAWNHGFPDSMREISGPAWVPLAIFAYIIGAIALTSVTEWVPRLATLFGKFRRHWAAMPPPILTAVAISLAGQERAQSLQHEWPAHLAGEDGQGLRSWRQFLASAGFVAAVVRFRCQDATDVWWRLADHVLKSRMLSNMMVMVPSWSCVLLIWQHAGLYGVLDDAGGLIAIGGLLYGLIQVGRRSRDVKPRPPKCRVRE